MHVVHKARSGGLFRRDRVYALTGADLTVAPGETVGVVGESGCGKSTLAKVLVGLQRPTAGTVSFRGEDLWTMTDSRRRSVIGSNVGDGLPGPVDRAEPAAAGAAGAPRPARRAPARHRRASATPGSRAARPGRACRRASPTLLPGQLSGGQRQRVAIARALALEPELLVADEPTSALDVSVRAQILNLLLDLKERLGLALVFVSHDIQTVRRMSDRVVTMYLGRIVEETPAAGGAVRRRATRTRGRCSRPRRACSRRSTRSRSSGPVPSATRPPSGCPFRTRCWNGRRRVRRGDAAGDGRRADHLFRCHHPVAERRHRPRTDQPSPGAFMTTATALTGVIPPVCTPLTPDYEVDTGSLTRLVDHLLDGGVDALFVLGSTSEVAFLPDAHRRVVLDTVVGHVAGQVPVLAGAIDMTTPAGARPRAGRRRRPASTAIVATAPFYARTHPAEIDVHFRTIAERAGVPVYAYDLPVSVHTKLGARPAARPRRRRRAGRGQGLQRRRGRAARRHPRPARPRRHRLVQRAHRVGADRRLRTVDGRRRRRARAGQRRPARLRAAVRRPAARGDWEAARAEQERLLHLFELVTVGGTRMGGSSSALGAFKAALYLRGVIDHPTTALPQIPLDDDEIARVGKYLAAAGLV